MVPGVGSNPHALLSGVEQHVHTTASVYAHVMPELRREAADRLAKCFSGQGR